MKETPSRTAGFDWSGLEPRGPAGTLPERALTMMAEPPPPSRDQRPRSADPGWLTSSVAQVDEMKEEEVARRPSRCSHQPLQLQRENKEQK